MGFDDDHSYRLKSMDKIEIILLDNMPVVIIVNFAT